MSHPVLRLEVNRALAFAVHKGRAPKDVRELAEWLSEFAELETRVAANIERAYREHLDVCNRPMVMVVPKP